MRKLPTMAILALAALAPFTQAGDLPISARACLEDRKLVEKRSIPMDPSLQVWAILPDGEEDPRACLLGPASSRSI